MKKPTKKIPTQKEIDAEIKWLTANKPKIRRITFFKDNNHDAIDAQIEVLKNNLTDQQIDDKSWFEDDESLDLSKWSPHTRDSAMQVYSWLNGYTAEQPSKGWKGLVEK